MEHALECGDPLETFSSRGVDPLRTLLEVNNILVSKLDFEELIEAIACCVRQVLGAEYSGVSVHDEASRKNGWLTLHFPGDKYKTDFTIESLEELDALQLSSLDLREVVEAVGGFLQRNGYSDLAIYDESSRKLHWLAMSNLHKWRSYLGDLTELKTAPFIVCRKLVQGRTHLGLSVPLVVRGNVIGILHIGHQHKDSFVQEEASWLHELARQVAIAVDNALAYQKIAQLKDKLARENFYLEEEIHRKFNFEEIIGESPALENVLKQVELVAESDACVLLLGETGTGKELFARAVHNHSLRRDRTLVKVNCAAIPAGLLESELFGHEKGAFTGATSSKMGRFELANEGTLFLDEVGDIPIELQAKLLRALQEKEFERIGGTRSVKVDVRVIAATNCNLEESMEKGLFRRDLYYRLNVFPIVIPPLRERREDIPLLVRYFTQKYSKRMKRNIESIPAESMSLLKNMSWRGNVRELENLIERSVILTRGSVMNVPLAELQTPAPIVPPTTNLSEDKHTENIRAVDAPTTSLQDAERQHILRTLRVVNGVVGGPKGAAVLLGLNRSTLVSKMRRLGISIKDIQ